MAIDFRANQIRTNKVISSGSTGTGANILFYDFGAITDNSGGINSSVFGTGSIGTDFFMFVSGAIGSIGSGGSHGVAGFGGDVYISGNLHLDGTSNISSIAADVSASYLVVGNTGSLPNERAIAAGNGIRFTDGGANSTFTISDVLWLESGSGNIRTTSSVAIGSTTFATGSGRDIFLFVSGAVSGAGTTTPSIAVFGGDVVISGNLYTSGSVKQRTRIAAGSYTTTTASVLAPLVAGQFYFDLREHFNDTITFRVVLSVAGLTTASVALYNITTAKYVHIGGSGITALSSSNLTPELKESVNLRTATNWGGSTPSIYEVQVYSSSSTILSILGGAELITL